MMRRNDILIPLSVIAFGITTIGGLLSLTDRLVSLESRLVRLEVVLSRVERSVDEHNPVP